MKKLILFFVLLFIIFGSVGFSAKAMTEQERQNLIYQIKMQIAQLQAQLQIMLQRENAGPGTVKIYGPDKKTGTITANYGESINISWEGKNVDSCAASGNWSGSRNIFGTASTGVLISSRVYNISCKDYSGKVVTSALTINVVFPEASIKANSATIVAGKSATLNWTAKGVKNCWAFGDWQGDKNLTGSESTGFLIYPRKYAYGISCNSNKGIINDIAYVNVSAPTANLKVNGSEGPLAIASGKSVTLSWTSSGILSCTALGNWSGTKKTSGSESAGAVTSAKFYVLECVDFSGNRISDSVSVTIK